MPRGKTNPVTGNASSSLGLIEDKSQEQRILERLQEAARSRQNDGWVSALDCSMDSLQYCARLHSLRKKLAEEGGVFVIENKLEISEGRRRGWYRLKRIHPEPEQADLFPSLNAATWRDPEEEWAR
jgi:hypothetical protein